MWTASKNCSASACVAYCNLDNVSDAYAALMDWHVKSKRNIYSYSMSYELTDGKNYLYKLLLPSLVKVDFACDMRLHLWAAKNEFTGLYPVACL